jgi:hypothetical protein
VNRDAPLGIVIGDAEWSSSPGTATDVVRCVAVFLVGGIICRRR